MTDIDYLKKYLTDKSLEEALILLKKGIPVQYIVGNVDFYGLNFNVDKNVLIPRFETELLVQKTISYIKKYFNKQVKILDIGTGSGVIAITLAKKIDSLVTACDISNKALALAHENAKKNEVNINFLESDIFSNIDEKFDVIISNPPYIDYEEKIDEMVRNNEPHLALFAKNKGLYFYEEILKYAKQYLNKKSIMAFEIGENQGESIKKIAYRYFPEAIISLEKDFPGKDRFIFIINGI